MGQDFFAGQEFKALDPKKQEILRDLAREAEGKTPMALMGLLETYQKRLGGEAPLTPAEKKALVFSLRQSLSEGEQKKFDRVLGLLGMR